MTKYKKVLKSKGYNFNEDYDYLPIDIDGISLEYFNCYVAHEGLLIVRCYNVDTWRYFLGRDLQPIPLLEDCDVVVSKDFEVGTIRIFHDMPKYQFVYDMSDKLRYIRYSENL